MKILITGGYGFLGYHLTNSLIDLNCEITLVDIFPEKNFDKDFKNLLSNKNIKYLQIDLINKNSFDKLQKDFTHVIHLAAILGVENVINNPSKVLSMNIAMLDNLITFSQSINPTPKLVFSSTSEVYAGTLFNSKLAFPTPEDSLLVLPDLKSPRTSYMLSKIYGETMCHASNLKTLIFRPHNLYGPRMGMKHVIPQLIKKIFKTSKNGELGVFSPKHTRTFCFIKDAAEQIKASITKEELFESKIFNLGTDHPEISMKDLAILISKIMQREDILIKELDDTLGSPRRRCPSTKLLDEFTKIYDRTNINNGIEETYNWYMHNKSIYLD